MIHLLKSFALPDFPSGSSINYHDEKFYLIGDDANTILILDREYHQIDSWTLFSFAEKRIPKPAKVDLEASTIITVDGYDHLLIAGSGATPQREQLILIPLSGLENTCKPLIIHNHIFVQRLQAMGIDTINIEGITSVGKNLILSNRSNRKNNSNHLIITAIDFWKHQAEAELKIMPIHIPVINNDAPGVSEICYVASEDLLLLTFSSELTDNAYDDGAIGNSYLGCIYHITRKIQQPTLAIDSIFNLTDIHSDFKNEKIEGVCVESIFGNTLILHLVSDNDLGESKLFKLSLTLPLN